MKYLSKRETVQPEIWCLHTMTCIGLFANFVYINKIAFSSVCIKFLTFIDVPKDSILNTKFYKGATFLL